jgi:hypothetical protein
VRGALKQVFAAVDREMAGQVLTGVVEQLGGVAPKVARLLADAEDDLLAYMRFPAEHWPKIRSTNPLERVNREIARRSDVVGIYPDDAALLRLASGLLVEMNDEWLVAHRYLSLHSMALLEAEGNGPSRARRRRPASSGGSAGRRRKVHHMTRLDCPGRSPPRSAAGRRARPRAVSPCQRGFPRADRRYLRDWLVGRSRRGFGVGGELADRLGDRPGGDQLGAHIRHVAHLAPPTPLHELRDELVELRRAQYPYREQARAAWRSAARLAGGHPARDLLGVGDRHRAPGAPSLADWDLSPSGRLLGWTPEDG